MLRGVAVVAASLALASQGRGGGTDAVAAPGSGAETTTAPATRVDGQVVGPPTLEPRPSGVDALLQAVSPVDAGVVWVSGHRGVWARTEDGGATWTSGGVRGADSLQFRDVDAFDARTAYLLSAGSGPASRIYRTDDGGATWRLQFRMDDPAGFLDCMAFWDPEHGVAYGDAVDGTVYVLRTEDGGETWARVAAPGAPPAQEGEGGFAASGSCVATGPEGRAWIGTGAAARARVLLSEDRGRSWTTADAPVADGPASGLTSVRVQGSFALAVGGTIGDEQPRQRAVALSDDGGRTWRAGGPLAMPGPAYGAAIVPGRPGPTLVAVGPGGLDWSPDGGATWIRADTRTHWAVAFSDRGVGWAVGPEGRITRITFPDTRGAARGRGARAPRPGPKPAPSARRTGRSRTAPDADRISARPALVRKTGDSA